MGSLTFARGRTLGLLAALLTLALAACGGGGGGSNPSPGSQTVTLLATASLDGYASSTGGASAHFGIYAGDFDGTENGRGSRGFVSFDLTAIPSGATIDYATFEIRQVGAEGNAFDNHGDLYLWKVDYGDTLEGDDYDAARSHGAILSQSVVPGERSVPVVSALREVWAAGGTRAQFCLSFLDQSSDSDFVEDGLWFDDAEGSQMSGSSPRLVVTYTPR